MWLFVLFLAIPLIEIALFVQVGGLIGLWPVLAIVVGTAFAGTYLVRNQGLQAMGNLQKSFSNLSDPSEPLAHGAMILFAGALLLTPGFFTDACGFALLVPGVRSWVFGRLRERVVAKSFTMGAGPQGPAGGPNNQPHGMGGPADGPVIDGEFEEISQGEKPTHEGSGWTKH
ncbi:MAG: FxsA family protein [Rhodobacteraceae bacterium]|nr:FxsA family protein [Paracoccaceae bacterium]